MNYMEAAMQMLLGWTWNSTTTTGTSNLIGGWAHPLGLSLGLGCVAVGQVCVFHRMNVFLIGGKLVTITYFYCRRELKWGADRQIQKEALTYDFWEGVRTHIAQPEGLILLGSYLSFYWMLNLMPSSYYSFEGSVNWYHVFAQLVIQDCIQTAMHLGEHVVSPKLYQMSHKPHHRWLNPRLFDAFNGSVGDTLFMILVPLLITSRVVYCNVWSYMAFGTIYSMDLVLIHSEHANPFDSFLRVFGIGTAADHHVHHKLFKFNYGHIFMWWDKLIGTYKDPKTVKGFKNNI